MTMRIWRWIIPQLLGLTLGGDAFAVSLADTVRETIESNPDILIAGSERDSVEQQMEQARGGFFPQVDISAGAGRETSDNPTTRTAGDGSRNLNRQEAEIRIRQLLFDGFGTKSEFGRQRARVNSQAYDTFATAEAVGLKAVEAYLNFISEQKLVQLATENLKSHQETYDRIVKRDERGVSSKADVQQSLGRLALARTNLMAEQNRLRDARATFRNIVGHDPANLAEPAPPAHLLPATLDEATAIAVENHPRLKSADAGIEAARQQHSAANALFFPRIDLEIKGSNNDNLDGVRGSNNDAEVMVRGQYKLTGGSDTAKRKESVFKLRQAREFHERTYRQVVEEIQLSWNAYETAKTQLEHFKVYEDASKQALVVFRKQFNIGQRTLLDLLDQENEVFQASINYINGLNDLIFSAYRILAGTGKLLWACEVKPPQQVNTIQ